MNCYTASEIARASGSISRQAVGKLLLDVAPTSVRVVSGNQETPCWAFSSLPQQLRERLEGDAQRQGCRNAETLLARPPSFWQSPAPLHEIADEDINRAAKLRDVL